MFRTKIDELFEKIRAYVEQDSSSLTRTDQDRIELLLRNVRKEIEGIYDEREKPCR